MLFRTLGLTELSEAMLLLGRVDEASTLKQVRIALTTAVALYRAMDMAFWLPQAEALLAQVAF